MNTKESDKMVKCLNMTIDRNDKESHDFIINMCNNVDIDVIKFLDQWIEEYNSNKYEKIIKDLQIENQELQLKNNTLNWEYKNELYLRGNLIETQREEIERLREQNSQFENRLERQKCTIQKYQQQNYQLKNQIEDKSRNGVFKLLSDLETEKLIDDMKNQITNLEQQIQRYEKLNEIKRIKINQLNDQLLGFRLERNKNGSIINELKQNIRNLTQKNNELLVQTKQNKVTQIVEKLKTKPTDFVSYKQHIEYLNKKYNEQESIIWMKQEQISSLTNIIEELKVSNPIKFDHILANESVKILQSKLKDMTERHNNMEDQVHKLQYESQRTRTILENKLTVCNLEKDSIQKHVTVLNNTIQELQRKLKIVLNQKWSTDQKLNEQVKQLRERNKLLNDEVILLRKQIPTFGPKWDIVWKIT